MSTLSTCSPTEEFSVLKNLLELIGVTDDEAEPNNTIRRALLRYMEKCIQMFGTVYADAESTNATTEREGASSSSSSSGGGSSSSSSSSQDASGSSQDDASKINSISMDEVKSSAPADVKAHRARLMANHLTTTRRSLTYNVHHSTMLEAAQDEAQANPERSLEGSVRLVLGNTPHTGQESLGQIKGNDNMSDLRDLLDWFVPEGGVALLWVHPDVLQRVTDVMGQARPAKDGRPASKWVRESYPVTFVRKQRHRPADKRNHIRKQCSDTVYEFRRQMWRPYSAAFENHYGAHSGKDGSRVCRQSVWFGRGDEMKTYVDGEKRKLTRKQKKTTGGAFAPKVRAARQFLPVPSEYTGIDLRRAANDLPLLLLDS
jgi:hypothetical protein